MPKMPPLSSPKSLCAACAAIASGACLIALGSPACGPACNTADSENPPERYEGGTVTGGQDRYYASSDWASGLLPFPGGKRYEIAHHLGFVPAEIAVYVSLGANAMPSTPCSGNTCVIQSVTADTITVKNDTCSEFWVRVVAAGVTPTWADAGISQDSGAAD
jgi:hypothetical protein